MLSQTLYCSLSVYLLLFPASYYLCSPILWSVFFISLVSHFVYLSEPVLAPIWHLWTLSISRDETYTTVVLV